MALSNYRIDKLELVLFDLDGTIRHNDPPGMQTFHDFLSERGWHVSERNRREAERWNLAYWASSEALRQDVEAAGEDREQLWTRYTDRHLQQLGLGEQARRQYGAIMMQAMQEDYQPQNVVPEDVAPTIAWLRSEKKKVGLISNRSQPMDELLHELDLAPLFDFTLAAGEINRWKPDPEIFEYALGKLQASPGNTLYVGDNPWADVEGAAAAGCLPVLIDPNGLFPEVQVPVVRSIGQLRPLLAGNGLERVRGS